MEFWNTVTDTLGDFRVESVIEILSITVLIYLVLLLVKGTTAMSVLRGMLIIVIGAVILVEALNLTVLNWLLRNSFPALLIALPIIFQQEIRRFLERIGR
ncbi:MAG: TIGR00159 family protein, partial [Chloroflexi bacterium]|nr:TIGR00159 family protein [Chloroflexota bacterium]